MDEKKVASEIIKASETKPKELTLNDIAVSLVDQQKQLQVVLSNINNRLVLLEQKPQPGPGSSGPAAGWIDQPESQQPGKMDLSQLAGLLPLLPKEETAMDHVYKDLGEKVFMRLVEKMLPTRREIRTEGGDLLK